MESVIYRLEDEQRGDSMKELDIAASNILPIFQLAELISTALEA